MLKEEEVGGEEGRELRPAADGTNTAAMQAVMAEVARIAKQRWASWGGSIEVSSWGGT